VIRATLREIIVECAQPRSVAAFWAEALGWTTREYPGGVLWMSASGGSDDDLLLVFVPSTGERPDRGGIQLAISPRSGDLDTEVERLVALGARVCPDRPEAAGWRVLADPEGNELCVLAPHGGEDGGSG